MTCEAGWWMLDRNLSDLVNRVTGERVVLRGAASAAKAGAPATRLRFDSENQLTRAFTSVPVPDQ